MQTYDGILDAFWDSLSDPDAIHRVNHTSIWELLRNFWKEIRK